MSFLKKEEVISLGPNPILNFLAEGGDVGKAHQDIFIVSFGPFEGRLRNEEVIRVI